MQKKYVVRLTDAEREVLNVLVKKQRVSSQKVRRARVLLKADADGPDWTDMEIANAFDCRTKTVENVRERFVTEGFEITLKANLRVEFVERSSTETKKPRSLPCGWGRRRKDSPTGPYDCWRNKPSHWKSWSR